MAVLACLSWGCAAHEAGMPPSLALSRSGDAGKGEMTAEHLARKYYRSINAKDVEGVLGVLSDEAVFQLPDGREVTGRDALRAMYTHVFAAGGPQPQPVRIVASDTEAAVEVEVTLADGSKLYMASFFTMGPGETFEKVAVYQRGR